MPDLLVLVNGLPGSGKTTLAVALGAELGATVLSKDAVKESLAESFRGSVMGSSGPVPGTLGAIAMETIWLLGRDIDATVVVDSFWFAPRDLEHARQGIARVAAQHVVEVWCDVPAELARERYAGRTRHQLHRDQERLASDWPEWARHAAPLDLVPVVRVDTTQPPDLNTIREQLLINSAEPLKINGSALLIKNDVSRIGRGAR